MYSPAFKSFLATVITSATSPPFGTIVHFPSITAIAADNGVSKLHK